MGRVYKLGNNYNCLNCHDKNWLISCVCSIDCLGVTMLRDKKGRPRKMLDRHSGMIRVNNRFRDSHGYWILYLPKYLRTHKNDTIKEHIYFYEQYNKCCLLKWGVVHHIDENIHNNMPWNLKGMMRGHHIKLHKKGKQSIKLGSHIDTSDRRCFSCKSKTTYISRPDMSHKTSRYIWKHLPYDKINWYCGKCYKKCIKHTVEYI